MDIFLDGMAAALTVSCLTALLVGILWGTIAGALPGISLLLALTLVLPFTYGLPVEVAILLIVGTAAGAQFGNGLTAIVIGVPGTSSAVLTVLEGHSLFKRGRGGEALALNVYSAAFGQMLGAIGFVLFIVPLTKAAPSFLAPEVFAMALFGLFAVASLHGGDMLKGMIAVVLGLLLATIGVDPISSQPRFVFGSDQLLAGLEVVPVTVGLLGLAELLYQVRTGSFPTRRGGVDGDAPRHPGRLRVPGKALIALIPVALFATVLGFVVGVIPGIGATTATFLVFQCVRWIARRPEELGKGSTEGLVAQNAADNAVVGGELVPTLGLGIPGSASMTLLFGALIIQGIDPGPLVLVNEPELTGAVTAGFFLAGVMLIPIGLVFSFYAMNIVKIWPPIIPIGGIVLVMIGAYTVRGQLFDVFAVIAFGLLGYGMRLMGFPVVATAIAFVLGNLLETTFRRGLLITHSSYVEFFTRPVTGGLLLLGLVLLGVQSWTSRRQKVNA